MLGENIIYNTSSHYQRIVLTRKKQVLRLYLNNNLQFSSDDEYRYHEALVHPLLGLSGKHSNVLILGGGDGMAAREILKYKDVEKITLVDLDQKLTDLFKKNPLLTHLNENSLNDARLQVINDDAFTWLKATTSQFDLIIIDFPDPSNYSVGKLYTTSFYHQLQKVMKPGCMAVVQSTSPLVAPLSYWCVNNTLKHVGFSTLPFHAYVPSFGEWGFFIFSQQAIASHTMQLPAQLKYFSEKEFDNMKSFAGDMLKHTDGIQRLDNQLLVSYFEKEWSEY
jgi:spermidine synthase